MEVVNDLTPIISLQLPDKEQAAKMLDTLNRGSAIARKKLDSIVEVTSENREEIIEELTKVKQIHDKIKATRETATKWLDEKKKQFMSFERDSDYSDKDSLYTQKRSLVQQYDQQVLEETRRKEAEAERQRQIGIYLAEVRAGVQRQLVDMLAAKKREFIEKFAKFKGALTLENIDAQVAKLVSSTPALKQEDYDRCFNTNFKLFNILSTAEEGDLQNSGLEYKDMVAKRDEINKGLHQDFLNSLKPELPYSKYNEDYVMDLTLKINEFRAGIDVLKTQLKESKDNAEKEAQRQEDLRKETQQQITQVNETKSQQMETVAADKDANVMEAEFTKQAITQDLPSGPVKKVVTFAHGQFLKPFGEIVAACTAHPDFPGITKKGSEEYIPAVQWWLTFYQTKVQIEERRENQLVPIIKGVVITEEAKTTIKSKK